MSNNQKFHIIRHFAILNNIVLFGKNNDMYFMCIITKILDPPKNPNYPQSEACIYIKDNDGIYYNIQVTNILAIEKLDKPINELFMYFLKRFAKEIYKILKKNSLEIQIKEENNKFIYFLYDIPPHIWCVAVGMITAEL